MKYQHPLRQILSQTRPHWDRDNARPAVRAAFVKALQCRTPELGAQVYASENEERIFYNTCKSRPCSSCGYRQTVQWQRERWAALPDVIRGYERIKLDNVRVTREFVDRKLAEFRAESPSPRAGRVGVGPG